MLDNPYSLNSPTKHDLISPNKSVNLVRYSENSTPTPKRSFVQDLRMKVVDNNFHGKVVDKITSEQEKPTVGKIVSTYGIDYGTGLKSILSDDPKINFNPNITKTQANFKDNNGLMNSKIGKNSFLVRSHPNLAIHTDLNQDQLSQNGENYTNTLSKNKTELKFNDINLKSCEFDSTHPLSNELNTIINENSDYFNHILGKCACNKCTCGKHKCKEHHLNIKQNGFSKSVYRHDFVKPLGRIPVSPLKNDFFTTYYNNQTMDLTTTMKCDYKSWNVGPPPRAKPDSNSVNVPFAGKTSYNLEFINWGSSPKHIEKTNHPLTVISELPFFSSTAYREAHGPWAPSRAESQKKKNEKHKKNNYTDFLLVLI